MVYIYIYKHFLKKMCVLELLMNKNKTNISEVSLLDSRCDFLKFGCPEFPISIGRGWWQENPSWECD